MMDKVDFKKLQSLIIGSVCFYTAKIKAITVINTIIISSGATTGQLTTSTSSSFVLRFS
jgi:hypothetical protein